MRRKYGNIKCEYRGQKFDSRKEMIRFIELESMLKSGKIKKLQTQVKLPVEINEIHICNLIVDFAYLDDKGVHYEDVKAFDIKTQKYLKTPVFNLKKRMVEAYFNIKIELF